MSHFVEGLLAGFLAVAAFLIVLILFELVRFAAEMCSDLSARRFVLGVVSVFALGAGAFWLFA